MKKMNRYLLILLVAMPPGLQAQVQSSAGLKLVATGELKLVLQDVSLINHGEFLPGNSTVLFKGSGPLQISGSKAINFHHLIIGEETTLDNDIQVAGNLTLEKGNLQLNNHTIDLGYSGRIEGERNDARITGNSGTIKAKALLNAPAGINPGNIGVEISSAVAMGETEIIRGHSLEYGADGQPLVQRYYDIRPQYNLNLHASLKFYYLDVELNNDKEDALSLFASNSSSGNWKEAGKDKGDINTNWIVKNDLSQLHRFSLSGASGGAIAQKTSVRLFPNPTPDRFTVLLNSDVEREATLSLYDQLGRLLEKKKIQARIGANNVTWNMGKYANGTYYLSLDNLDLKPVKIVKD